MTPDEQQTRIDTDYDEPIELGDLPDTPADHIARLETRLDLLADRVKRLEAEASDE